MSDLIQIQWTTGSIEEARKVSRYLVQHRMVACAQITPWTESIYMWNNELETEQETKVLLKTTEDRYQEIRQVIEENCKYEVPEITYLKIEGGNDAYLNWVKESTPELQKA